MYCAPSTIIICSHPSPTGLTFIFRTGFFHNFKPRELVALRWDAAAEMLVDDVR
jgi:hypothetical protein